MTSQSRAAPGGTRQWRAIDARDRWERPESSSVSMIGALLAVGALVVAALNWLPL